MESAAIAVVGENRWQVPQAGALFLRGLRAAFSRAALALVAALFADVCGLTLLSNPRESPCAVTPRRNPAMEPCVGILRSNPAEEPGEGTLRSNPAE